MASFLVGGAVVGIRVCRPETRGESRAREREIRLKAYRAKKAEMRSYAEAHLLAAGQGSVGTIAHVPPARALLRGESISDADHWSPASAAQLAEWEVMCRAGMLSESTLAARVRRQALIEVCSHPRLLSHSFTCPVMCLTVAFNGGARHRVAAG